MRSVAGVLILSVLAGGLSAQIPTAFDVTSVKAVKADSRQRAILPDCSPGGLFRSPFSGVAAVIRWAYDIQPYQLTGMPDWARRGDAIFDVEGKAAGPIALRECRLMVQALLADRFQLTIHRETKTLPLNILTVDKNGSKLQPVSPNDTGNLVRINGTPGYGGEKGWSMAQLTEFLSRGFSGEPVVDRTGLEGFYRIAFDFEIRAGVTPADEMAAAVQRQLGLRIERRKEPLEVIVVDRLTRPEAN